MIDKNLVKWNHINYWIILEHDFHTIDNVLVELNSPSEMVFNPIQN